MEATSELENRLRQARLSTTPQTLEPAFFARSPSHVKYAKQPICVKNEYSTVPRDAFAAEHGFQWTDTVWLPQAFRDRIWRATVPTKEAMTELETRLHQPLDSLVVCEINPSVGKGVFLALDAAPIPPGTIIGVYAGELAEAEDNPLNPYAMSLLEAPVTNHNSLIDNDDFYNIPITSANARGNIIRLIQDLPESDEIDAITNLTLLQKSNIMSANLMVYPTVVYGTKCSYLFASREIKPGEQLGFTYLSTASTLNSTGDKQIECNNSTIQRAVFNTQGIIIGHFSRENFVEFDPAYTPTAAMAAPRMNMEVVRKQVVPLIYNPSFNAFDYSRAFIENVNYTLALFLKRYKENDPGFALVKSVHEAFNLEGSTDDRFKALRAAMVHDKNKALVNTHFKELKAELSFHMAQYIAKNPKWLDAKSNRKNTPEERVVHPGRRPDGRRPG